jgi:hypothetical protein
MTRATTPSKAKIARIVSGLKAAGETIGRGEIKANGDVFILTGAPEATLTPLERFEAEKRRRAERASKAA